MFTLIRKRKFSTDLNMDCLDYKYYQLIESLTGKNATIAVIHHKTANANFVRIADISI